MLCSGSDSGYKNLANHCIYKMRAHFSFVGELKKSEIMKKY